MYKEEQKIMRMTMPSTNMSMKMERKKEQKEENEENVKPLLQVGFCFLWWRKSSFIMRFWFLMPNLSELYRWTSRTCGRRRGKCTTALLFISKIPSLFWKCCKHNMRIRNSSIYKKFSGQNVWTSYTGNNPILFAFVGVHNYSEPYLISTLI